MNKVIEASFFTVAVEPLNMEVRFGLCILGEESSGGLAVEVAQRRDPLAGIKVSGVVREGAAVVAKTIFDELVERQAVTLADAKAVVQEVVMPFASAFGQEFLAEQEPCYEHLLQSMKVRCTKSINAALGRQRIANQVDNVAQSNREWQKFYHPAVAPATR
jgi:hypothetical protein